MHGEQFKENHNGMPPELLYMLQQQITKVEQELKYLEDKGTQDKINDQITRHQKKYLNTLHQICQVFIATTATVPTHNPDGMLIDACMYLSY